MFDLISVPVLILCATGYSMCAVEFGIVLAGFVLVAIKSEFCHFLLSSAVIVILLFATFILCPTLKPDDYFPTAGICSLSDYSLNLIY